MRDPRWPPDRVRDDVVEAYKKDVDRTLIRENLKLTPEERIRRLQDVLESVTEWQDAAETAGLRPRRTSVPSSTR